LAEIHKNTHENFGLEYDNYIGELPQKNTYAKNWVDFFIENRLEVQIGLAYYKRLIDENFLKKFKRTYPQLYKILPKEKPSLLHGDLWSGNVMVDTEGMPCLIDPAIYYGHREAEIAYSTLFGGFDSRFYSSYIENFPLQPGFEERKEIYNMYHLLVHVNLFGLSYLAPVERTVNKLQ
jgi:protein-ribulosamine 3-kinase